METIDLIHDVYFGHDIFTLENDLQRVYFVPTLVNEYDWENVTIVYPVPPPKLDKRGYLPLMPEIGHI